MVCHAPHFNFNTVQLDFMHTHTAPHFNCNTVQLDYMHTLHKYKNLVALMHIHDILYPAYV